jgi:cell division septation protein DedD
MLSHEETTDGAAGVEVESRAPERQQPLIEHQEPLVLDAVAVAEESRPAAASAPAPDFAPAQTPDFYAVGVRLIKMSPVWLLTVTSGFALLILLLSWVRPGVGEADAAPIPNDAKSVAVQPRQPTAAPAPSAETPAAPLKEEHSEVAPKAQPAEHVEIASAKPAAAESKPAEPKKEPARVSTSADESGATFTVQVGSFSATSQANERVSSLRAAGFDARSTAVEIPGRGTWHRVQVGRFREREEAAKVAAQLREKAAASGSMVVAIQ